ncbi:iron ABC transporter substrate-binding protein [Phytoactinopolyspora limicola]|uniref:iron ABC transporter substrate-binding protein n=1 Tax=Phytoactinopolyspora limicola TaxID=2715536 RepID=UPI001408042B|nr:iron ABC transporter substrate-binding protein [Phytoactinopolyspora limicola]
MKLRVALGVIAVPMLIVAGCGSDDDTDATNDDTTAAADEDTDADENADGDESGDDDTGDAPEPGSLTVYSGRSEELVGPIIDQFEADTGIEVVASYGDTAEKAAQILDEGANSPADVFFGQDAGALGALSAAGVLAPLPQDQLDLVDPAYRSDAGDWVGVSGRARVVVYNTDRLDEADLPDTIAGLTDPEWEGRIGWAPTNGSFQAFVTAMRVIDGDDATAAWLEAMRDNNTQVYERNGPIVDAVAAGEVDAGLVNHYYLYPRLVDEPDLAAANKFYGDGDPGALVNVAGAGILQTSEEQAAAAEFVEYLLSETGQTYFVEETWEFPLVKEMDGPEGLPSIDELTPPAIDLGQLEDLEGTLDMLTQTGVL